MNFPILFEDGEALVIDKPAGLPLDRPRAGGPCLEDHLEELKLGFGDLIALPDPPATEASETAADPTTRRCARVGVVALRS